MDKDDKEGALVWTLVYMIISCVVVAIFGGKYINEGCYLKSMVGCDGAHISDAFVMNFTLIDCRSVGSDMCSGFSILFSRTDAVPCSYQHIEKDGDYMDVEAYARRYDINQHDKIAGTSDPSICRVGILADYDAYRNGVILLVLLGLLMCLFIFVAIWLSCLRYQDGRSSARVGTTDNIIITTPSVRMDRLGSTPASPPRINTLDTEVMSGDIEKDGDAGLPSYDSIVSWSY